MLIALSTASVKIHLEETNFKLFTKQSKCYKTIFFLQKKNAHISKKNSKALKCTLWLFVLNSDLNTNHNVSSVPLLQSVRHYMPPCSLKGEINLLQTWRSQVLFVSKSAL